MKINKAPLDATGRRIEVGHIIAYPLRDGSRLWQNFAIVRDITYNGKIEQDGDITYIHPLLHVDKNTIKTYTYAEGNTKGWQKASVLMRTKIKNYSLTIITPMTEKWYMHHFKIGEIVEEYPVRSLQKEA